MRSTAHSRSPLSPLGRTRSLLTSTTHGFRAGFCARSPAGRAAARRSSPSAARASRCSTSTTSCARTRPSTASTFCSSGAGTATSKGGDDGGAARRGCGQGRRLAFAWQASAVHVGAVRRVDLRVRAASPLAREQALDERRSGRSRCMDVCQCVVM
eukprot:5268493-Prymnesium_polylepis.1